jgi:hypothetical protein
MNALLMLMFVLSQPAPDSGKPIIRNAPVCAPIHVDRVVLTKPVIRN